jgi:hypothetical protein
MVGCVALLLTTVVPMSASAASRAERQGQRPAALNVRPRMAMAGSGVRILVRVPADAENRRLRVTIDSESFSRTSEIDLEGLRAAEAHWFDLPALPAGDYLVEAVVYGSTGERRRIQDRFSRQ